MYVYRYIYSTARWRTVARRSALRKSSTHSSLEVRYINR